jgi:hypothetical protein
MRETAGLTRTNAGLMVPRRSGAAALIVGSALAVGLAANAEVSSFSTLVMDSVASKAQAQPVEASRRQLRAKIKSAAEKLNDIASAAPGMIRAMFAGNTPSASLLALDEKSIAAQAELRGAILAAQKSGALTDKESKELARLGELAKKTRDPVKEDIETLKAVPDLPIVGRDAAVRLAPKSEQVAIINNAEAAKSAVGALAAAIKKLP